MTTTEETTVWQLARSAECGDPDGLDSPGAMFLTHVAADVDELRERVADGEDVSDVIHELADALVPVYTYERWQVFTDLAAWEQDVTDYAPDSSDMTEAAGVALYIIAERLLQDLVQSDG